MPKDKNIKFEKKITTENLKTKFKMKTKNPKTVFGMKKTVKTINQKRKNQKQILSKPLVQIHDSIDQNEQIKIEKAKNNVQKGTHRNTLPTIKCFVPKAYPYELTVEVSNLPSNYKQIDIIETFSSYGHITFVQNVSKKKAVVAFLHQEEATAAVMGNNVLKIGHNVLKVKKRSKKIKEMDMTAERTIFVFRSSPTTTEDDIKNHFDCCGKISAIISKNRATGKCFVLEFADKASAQAALKLHNSNLRESIITVRLRSNQFVPWYPTRTIVLLNESGLTKLEGSTVTNIFAKCGKIENCDVLCEKRKLAIVTFATKEDAARALELNGKSKNGLIVTVELYADELKKNAIPPKVNPYSERLELAKAKKRKVYLKKIPEGASADDLKNFFVVCGPVKTVSVLPERGALIEFENSDGYCKAFTLHQVRLMDQILYLVPFSDEKPEKVETTSKRRIESYRDGIKKKIKKSLKKY